MQGRNRPIMSIRRQIGLLLVLVFSFTLTTGLASIWGDLERRFLVMEANDTRTRLERTAAAFIDQIENIPQRLGDWAEWDEAAEFLKRPNKGFIASNLNTPSLTVMQLDSIRYYNLDRKLVGKADHDTSLLEEFSSAIDSFLDQHPEIFPDAKTRSPRYGLVRLIEHPYILAIQVVRGTKGQDPAYGYVVFLKQIDKDFSSRLQRLTAQKLVMHHLDQSYKNKLSHRFAAPELSMIHSMGYTQSSDDVLEAELNLLDIFQQPILQLRLSLPREVLAQGRTSMHTLLIVFLFILVLSVGSLMIGLHRLVSSRLEKLSRDVAEVDIDEVQKAPQVNILGRNEIATLGHQINTMLLNIYHKNHKLWQKSRDIRSLLDHTPIGLISFGADLTIHKDYSRSMEEILGQKHLGGRDIREVLFHRIKLGQDTLAKMISALEFSFGDELIFFEANLSFLPRYIQLEGTHGIIRSLELDWRAMLDEFKCVDRILLSLRDVSETKRLQKEAEESRKSQLHLHEILQAGPDIFIKLEQELIEILPQIKTKLAALHIPALQRLYLPLHSLKSRCRLYKFQDLSDTIHDLEDALDEILASRQPQKPILELCQAIEDALDNYHRSLEPLLRIKPSELGSLEERSLQRTECNLHRIFSRAEPFADQLAKQRGKGGFRLEFLSKFQVFISPKVYQAFEASLDHFIANAIDHGLEPEELRAQLGKPLYGTLRGDFDENGFITLQDDGRGICLTKVREFLGDHSHALSPAECLAALWQEGFSTADAVTPISGRGLGMAAARELLRAEGMEIQLIPLYEDLDQIFLPFQIRILLPKGSYRVEASRHTSSF